MLTGRRWGPGGAFVVNQLTSDTPPENLYRSTGTFLRLFEGTEGVFCRNLPVRGLLRGIGRIERRLQALCGGLLEGVFGFAEVIF
jgi:hypothetical protein